MAKGKKTSKTVKVSKPSGQKPIEQYEHKDKERLNIPPVGLVDSHTDPITPQKKKYSYDPHLDPQLQWAGKTEHTSFEVPTKSLHVHERIDPRRIIESVTKNNEDSPQGSLFGSHRKPLREAIEFYKHKENWSNRLIAGDSLLVMNSLLEKEGMAGKVQMIYFDPPYGIKYGSNFQPFVNKRDVKDGKDEDLTAEPEMIKAFRDTWELGIHSYLTYLRDRLLLAKELLHVSGSVFVQISDENVHLLRNIMDDIFGASNFIALIPFRKKAMTLGAKLLENMYDYILWYAKDKSQVKYNQLYIYDDGTNTRWDQVELPNGEIRATTQSEKDNPSILPKGARLFNPFPIQAPSFDPKSVYGVQWEGQEYWPPKGTCWITAEKEKIFEQLRKGKIFPYGGSLAYKQYLDDFPYKKLTNIWNDTRLTGKIFVVQTASKILERCILMSTNPGDLVMDITCGSGTSAVVAENWGRRWITCDTSRIAITLSKQRLIASIFDYYELAHNDEGIGSGLKYEVALRISLKSVANNELPENIILFDRPIKNKTLTRVTGPFTVEAVPAPVARSFDDIASDSITEADASLARTGETLRQDEWRQELLRTGVRGKGGNRIMFSRVEPLSGTKYLQAEAETKIELDKKDLFQEEQPTLMQQPKRVAICFGPEHAPLEQRTVELAIEEARRLVPKPDIVLFCSFHFDPEARKDIEELNWPGMTILEAQMNADLLTDDLKKNRSSNDSFWLIGQPDVLVQKITTGDHKGKIKVEVKGFDYYNPVNGSVQSGGKADIAMWMLDEDYDGRSLLPSQVFLPMAGAKEGWATLARNLKAEIDEEKMEAYHSTVSLPFTPGQNIAVKIIDARGIESLKVIRL